MSAKKAPKGPEDTNARLERLERAVFDLKDRCLQVERAVRIIGREFGKTHLTESQARSWAQRANSLQNAMREIRENLTRFGDEFDKAPHFQNPDEEGYP